MSFSLTGGDSAEARSKANKKKAKVKNTINKQRPKDRNFNFCAFAPEAHPPLAETFKFFIFRTTN
jgi:hypothetical protein